jgi:hypothetical protein
MTEQHVLARTGASPRTHHHRTVTSYLRLRDLAPDLPFIPVLQGRSVADYLLRTSGQECDDLRKVRLVLTIVGALRDFSTHFRRGVYLNVLQCPCWVHQV